MKRYISAVLAVILIAALTACGGGAQQAASSPSPAKTYTVPDVAGQKFQEARTTVLKDFVVRVVGKDGKDWLEMYPDKTATIVSTKPAAGTVTDQSEIKVTVNVAEAEVKAAREAADAKAYAAATAAAEAEKLANRYTFACGADTYHSYKDVWASQHYTDGDTCTVSIAGVGIYDHPTLLRNEQDIADVVAAHGGGGGGSASSDYGRVLQLCTILKRGYADEVIARMDWKKAEAQGALALCPDAPHAAVFRDVISNPRVGDGTSVVGKDMEPGTYRTKPGSKDCYWARTTGGGDIIANDMVGFAPSGVTVTVYPGEGFESSRCGVWTKIG